MEVRSLLTVARLTDRTDKTHPHRAVGRVGRENTQPLAETSKIETKPGGTPLELNLRRYPSLYWMEFINNNKCLNYR